MTQSSSGSQQQHRRLQQGGSLHSSCTAKSTAHRPLALQLSPRALRPSIGPITSFADYALRTILPLTVALATGCLAHGRQGSLQISPVPECGLLKPSLDSKRPYRIRDVFLLGEKSTSATEEETKDTPSIDCAIRQLFSGSQVNATGLLEVYLVDDTAILDDLRNKGYNVILEPEIRRRGETNWLRIEAPNRYYRKVMSAQVDTTAVKRKLKQMAGLPRDTDIADSALSRLLREKLKRAVPESVRNYHADNPGCLMKYVPDSPPLGLTAGTTEPTFPVSSAELSRNEYIREGSRVPVLYFYDLLQRFDCPYLRDLKDAAKRTRPFLTLDLQALPIVAAENTPQMYQARDGDRLRIRIIAAEQDVRQRDRALELINDEAMPDIEEYRASIHLTLVDDLVLTVAEYGLRLQIVPAGTYASVTSDSLRRDQFNPIKTAPAVTSILYPAYRGRRAGFKTLNWAPGVFVSLLGVDGKPTNFTIGAAWSPPSWRRWLSAVVGFHDLRDLVVGIALSPRIDFNAMLSREKAGP